MEGKPLHFIKRANKGKSIHKICSNLRQNTDCDMVLKIKVALTGCKYACCSKSNASYLFPWKLFTKSAITVERIHSYKTLFCNVLPTISYAFSPVMNKSLHAVHIKICTSGGDPLSLSPLLKRTTDHFTVLTSTVTHFCVCTHDYVRHHFVWLSLGCHRSHGNEM